MSPIVHNREIIKNTMSTTILPPSDKIMFETKDFWVDVAKELKELETIIFTNKVRP